MTFYPGHSYYFFEAADYDEIAAVVGSEIVNMFTAGGDGYYYLDAATLPGYTEFFSWDFYTKSYTSNSWF